MNHGPANLQAGLAAKLRAHATALHRPGRREGRARRREGAACANPHARAGSQTRVASMGGSRDAAALLALAQASNPRATMPGRSLPTQAAQTKAIWWPSRLPPERQTMGRPSIPAARWINRWSSEPKIAGSTLAWFWPAAKTQLPHSGCDARVHEKCWRQRGRAAAVMGLKSTGPPGRRDDRDDRTLRPQNAPGGTRTRELLLESEARDLPGHASSCGSHGGRPPRESLGSRGTPPAGLEPAVFGLEV